MSDIAQAIAEIVGGGSPTEQGFITWCITFIPIMVVLLAIKDYFND